MFAIMVAMHAQVHRILFHDAEAARNEIKRFEERLTELRWSKNREESPTHTVDGPEGPAVFVVEKVECVRMIDTEVESAIIKPYTDSDDDCKIQRYIKFEKAKIDAGLTR